MADVSFMDNENQMVIDATLSEIADELLDSWMQSIQMRVYYMQIGKLPADVILII